MNRNLPMRMPRWRALASPVAAATATIVLSAALIATLSLAGFDPRWTLFLCGMLASAVIASASHAANARWLIARRNSQLNATRERLAAERRARGLGDERVPAAPARVERVPVAPARVERVPVARAAVERVPVARAGFEFVDTMMPAMLAYVDAAGVVRYHNRAYAKWLGVSDAAIDGKRVRDLLGTSAYAAIETELAQAMEGHDVRYERAHTSRGVTSRLFVQYLPHFAEGGKVQGLFAILTDISTAAIAAPAVEEPVVETPAEMSAAERIVTALERDEFCLYSQSITALAPGEEGVTLCEVLLRLKEEERNHLPPGSFLPIAEEHGLLPQIDRWVVRKVLDSAAAGTHEPMIYMLNVAPQSIAQGSFAVFVKEELSSRKLAGTLLGFEFAESDVLANPRAYRDFTATLKASACRFAVTGFGQSSARVETFSALGIHYLKIDGGLVLSLLRYPGDLAKVKAINQAARAAKILTIAECVENEVTRAALRRIGTDYAQGFGISMPRPMPGNVLAGATLDKQAA